MVTHADWDGEQLLQVRDLRALRDLLAYHLEDLDDVLDTLRRRNGAPPAAACDPKQHAPTHVTNVCRCVPRTHCGV